MDYSSWNMVSGANSDRATAADRGAHSGRRRRFEVDSRLHRQPRCARSPAAHAAEWWSAFKYTNLISVRSSQDEFTKFCTCVSVAATSRAYIFLPVPTERHQILHSNTFLPIPINTSSNTLQHRDDDAMQNSQQNESTPFRRDNRSSDTWSDGKNFSSDGGGTQRANMGPQGAFLPSGQMQGQHPDLVAANEPTSAQRDGPAGVFASHGGQLGTDTGAQYGGDFNYPPTGDRTSRATAGRDDPFASSAPNFAGGPGPAIPGGNVQKGAGRVLGNSDMVERGEMRKVSDCLYIGGRAAVLGVIDSVLQRLARCAKEYVSSPMLASLPGRMAM
ncbi:hypothetical protein ONZ51_g12711 [Trametes cubensis]|uniref:Uncharacterized protein n=1 Tax=Trametes cubensis TaxID=1111947 RepID=A0AAD7THS8_9APHY|nr:hypothetical protein ONZ51_g12711 [Trametes cubensis]